jgi:hypothetical protein
LQALAGFVSLSWDTGSDGDNTHTYLSWNCSAVDEQWRLVSLPGSLELVDGAHTADEMSALLRRSCASMGIDFGRPHAVSCITGDHTNVVPATACQLNLLSVGDWAHLHALISKRAVEKTLCSPTCCCAPRRS